MPHDQKVRAVVTGVIGLDPTRHVANSPASDRRAVRGGGEDGRVTHRVYNDGFVVLPNSAVNDDKLTFRARGLLAYMLGRPPGWRYSADRLSSETPEGRDAVRTALRELTAAGYYRARRVQSDRGVFRMVTEVASRPELLPPIGVTGGGIPAVGLPAAGKAAPYVSTETHYREPGSVKLGSRS